MASPFSIFRKYQKAMIAFLALLAMVAFVFLDAMNTSLKSRSAENPVAVSTKRYGDLKESDLGRLRSRRQRLFNFLQGAIGLSSENELFRQEKVAGNLRR